MPFVPPLSLPAWLARPLQGRAHWLRPQGWGRWALAPGMALALAGGWVGGGIGVTMSAAAALLTWLIGLQRPTPGSDEATQDHGDAQGTPERVEPTERGDGLHLLVHELTDEWSKQLQLGRDQNREGLEKLLMTFTSLSDVMTSMASRLANFKPNVAAGVIGEVVDAQRPALDELMAPLERAFAERESMRAQLKVCADTLGSLLDWSKGARELAQHTRMVAFNASIEAVRGSSGSPDEMAARQTISTEIRRVSESIIALCDAMDQLMQPLHAASHSLQQKALIQDTNDEQLRAELELRARHAITAMFESIGGSLTTGSEIQEASEALSAQLEQAFTEFQFGDRVEQMLQILNRDIDRLCDYSAKREQPSANDIKSWLNKLAESYTMDEQRSQHHNTELVDRSSRVEFF